MQISILLLKQIVQLFLMILMGYIMIKIKFLKEEDSKVISKIILYLIVPSVIITAFQVDYTPSIMKGLAVIILLGMKNWHPQAENIILITYMAAITPCASTITQMCQVYGNDSKYASAINVMTTLLAVVTMPVFVYFYMNL